MNGSNARTLRLALLAILQLAVLLFPLSAANALPQFAAAQTVIEHDHAHDDEPGDRQLADPGAGIHAADHSHDVPGAVALTVPLIGRSRQCWRQVYRQASPLGRLFDIDRPPRGAIPA